MGMAGQEQGRAWGGIGRAPSQRWKSQNPSGMPETVLMEVKTRGAVPAKTTGKAAKGKLPCGRSLTSDSLALLFLPLFLKSLLWLSLPRSPPKLQAPLVPAISATAPNCPQPLCGQRRPPLGSITRAFCPPRPTSLADSLLSGPSPTASGTQLRAPGGLHTFAAEQANVHKAPAWCRRRRPEESK